jgi:hypothetical protein
MKTILFVLFLTVSLFAQDKMYPGYNFVTTDFTKRLMLDICTYDGQRIHESCSYAFTIYDTLFVLKKGCDKRVICLKNIKSFCISINDSLYAQPIGTCLYMNEIRILKLLQEYE